MSAPHENLNTNVSGVIAKDLMSNSQPNPPPPPPPPSADPDQTWRILGLVNDWIKHAEAKAAGTLAAAGVAAGVLYNLVKGISDTSRFLDLVAIACAVCIGGGGAAAAWALRPRLRAREDPTSGLYFHHIARRHPKATNGAQYLAELHGLSQDKEALVSDISGQVWANAHVATDKFKAGGIGLNLVLLGIVLLGITSATVAWESW